MSPNIEILKNLLVRAHDTAMLLLIGALVLLTGLLGRGMVGKRPRTVAKHRLDSHAESVYLWDLLTDVYGPEDSQEIRLRRADRRGERRRVNSFLTVDMILSRRADA